MEDKKANDEIYNKSKEEIIEIYKNLLEKSAKDLNDAKKIIEIKDKELKEVNEELKDAKKNTKIKDKELKEAKKKNEEFGDLNKIPKQIIYEINRSSTTQKGLRINELIYSKYLILSFYLPNSNFYFKYIT